MQQVVSDNSTLLRPAPPPPTSRSNFEPDRDSGRSELIRDDNEFFMFEPVKSVDFSFKTIHEEYGKPILLAMKERKALKESAEKPLIQF